MTGNHYSAAELVDVLAGATVENGLGDHIDTCEQCHYLWVLVRHARGDPSDEQREVTVDALRAWTVNR